MSASLSIRNVDDDLVAGLKKRAAANGRSAEAEMREILRLAVRGQPHDAFATLAAEVRALTADRVHTPSLTLLREARDER